MKYYKAFKLTYKKNKEFSVSEFQLVAKTLCFTTLFLFCFTIISPGVEPIPELDFSGSGPLFLSKNQMRADILQAERILRESYGNLPFKD
jgi:hypothetical protein